MTFVRFESLLNLCFDFPSNRKLITFDFSKYEVYQDNLDFYKMSKFNKNG